MELKLRTSQRDQLIAIGHVLGNAFKAERRDRPWTVCLNGDGNSGKSLIALAVDQALNPHCYPFGLKPDISAAAQSSFSQRSVIFRNYGYDNDLDCDTVDEALAEDSRFCCPTTQVFIASNLEGSLFGKFNAAAWREPSEKRDVAIRVYRITEFYRHIGVILQDNAFGQTLHQRLSNLQKPELR